MSSSPWKNEIFALRSLAEIDKRFLPGTENEVDFIENELGLSEGDSVVDLGCGAGRHSIELAKRCYRVTGLDISPIMLNTARERADAEHVNIKFAVCDLRGVDDFFLGGHSLFHGAICICESGFGILGDENDLKLLKIINNLLVPGSKLILTTYNGIKKYRSDPENNRKFDLCKGTIDWETPDSWEGGEKLTEKQRIYIPSELAMLFRLSGFRNTEFYGCSAGAFDRQALKSDDIELMAVAKKGMDN